MWNVTFLELGYGLMVILRRSREKLLDFGIQNLVMVFKGVVLVEWVEQVRL